MVHRQRRSVRPQHSDGHTDSWCSQTDATTGRLSAMSNSTAPVAPQLPRVLGPWMATAIVVGTVIGSGVFKKPYAVAKDVPEFGLAIGAWALVGLLAMLGALALAEVATLLPRAGGNYVFLREGYGRLAGFLWGWVD